MGTWLGQTIMMREQINWGHTSSSSCRGWPDEEWRRGDSRRRDNAVGRHGTCSSRERERGFYWFSHRLAFMLVLPLALAHNYLYLALSRALWNCVLACTAPNWVGIEKAAAAWQRQRHHNDPNYTFMLSHWNPLKPRQQRPWQHLSLSRSLPLSLSLFVCTHSVKGHPALCDL